MNLSVENIVTSKGSSFVMKNRSFISKFASLLLVAGCFSAITASTAVALTCAQGGPCSVGDTGPGGGIVFYKSSTPFKCGSDLLSDCNILEVAPSNWKVSEPIVTWTTTSCGPRCQTVPGIVDVRTADFSLSSIGLGYKYSLAMLSQVSDVSFAAGQARGYAGGGKGDWYLPTSAELNQLCKYVSGQAWTSDATACTGSATPALGMKADLYWSSNEFPKPLFVDATVNDVYMSWATNFSSADKTFFSQTNNNTYVTAPGGSAGIRGKDSTHYVRPIRAFYVASPTGDQRSYGLEYSQGNNLSFSTLGGFSSYTVDAWVRVHRFNVTSTNSQNVVPVVLLGGNSYAGTTSIWANTATDWQIDFNGVGNRHFTCPALEAKSWHHVAISQNSSNIGFWVDGVACTSSSYANYYSLAFTNVGFSPYHPGSASGQADISGMRIENVSNYSPTASTITVPGYPLPSTSNTKLLLNKTSVTTGDKDSSGLVTLTVNGSLSQSRLLQVTPTLSLSLPSSATAATYGTSVVITASVSTPGAVTFKVGGTAITGCESVAAASTTATCTWTPDSVSASTILTADFAPSDATNYASLSAAGSTTINVGKKSQTISFTQPSNMTYLDVDQAVTFSVNSALTVALTSSTTSVCTIVSGKIHIVSAGTCTVSTNQSGDSNYSAATQVTYSITISRATSSIEISGTNTYNFNGSAQGPSSSTKTGSGGAVTYSYQGTGSTIYSASTTKPTNAGTYTVTATVAEDSGYSSATSTPLAFSIGQISESSGITITSVSATYGTNLSLTTSGASGGTGAVTFNVDSGSCTIFGSTLTPTAAGTCMVTASKATDGNYLASTSPSTAITVSPKGLTISGLTGVNKEFDRGLVGTATGTPTLVGKVGSDDVLLAGTPTFTFASANVADGISLVASGYTLTGSTAGNYTLTQPTVTANITAKAARISATNTTVAYGATVTSGFTTSGLISPDAVGSASYTYTGTGTATPPTAVGVYTVTPSNAVFSTGQIGNYTITYDTATVTILAKYTITYNANGGVVASGSTTTVDFVVGDAALTLPTPSRSNYRFLGWYTLQSNGVQVSGQYTPTATATLWAYWIQNSLDGMGSNTNIFTLIISNGGGWDVAPSAGGGTVGVNIPAGALADGTVVTGYLLSDTSTATSVIGSGNDYVMSLVLAWVHPATGLVENTATGKPITMTITNSVIKKGAKIYSVIGSQSQVLTTASVDGIAVIQITEDPQIIIAITKPDAPTGVSATSGGNASTTVSWTAPSDGGSAITSYTATSNAGQTCTSVTTTCSVTGLTNGTPYTFTVTATNAIGTSDPSAPSSGITPVAPAVPVVTPPSSGGGGSTYVAPTPEPVPTVDPAVAAAAAAKALADAKAAEEKAIAEAKALAEKRAAEEAELLAVIKALQEKADAEALAAALKLQEELAATQLRAEEELKAAAALKLAEEQRIAAERAVAAKRITTVYSSSAVFKLNKTYTKRLDTFTKRIASGSTVTCIGYAKGSKTLTYAKAKVVATKQAKALCSSMKKINPTLKTKSIVYPASKAPVTTVNKKWIPVSYRIESPVN